MPKRLLGGLFLLLFLALAACSRPAAPPEAQGGKLRIVATLFPLYDFAKEIGGDQVEVTLLLPPGVEAHSFDPKPDDILRVNRAGLFVFTNRAMESWAAKVIAGVDPRQVTIVDASAGARLLRAAGDGHDDHEHAGEGIDPHLWLDFANAGIMVENLATAMAARDPAHGELYRANAAAYRAKLAALDDKYRQSLAGCKQQTLLQGGHFAFGYLAARYGLTYRAAAALNPEAEPTATAIAGLVKEMRASKLRYLYSEELVSPGLAETIAKETGGKVLPLNAAHNLSKADLERGSTFIGIMERNLENLKTGLECR